MSIEVHGFCDERFAPLRDAFIANFDADLDLGASLGVTHEGRDVVHIWAGFANPKRTRVWNEDTIVAVASSTKLLLAIGLLMQVDRGLIELDAPVARYWPAFAQGGKAAVTVRDVLRMQGGIPGLDPPAPFAVACDWTAIIARVAAEPHWFGGERRLCYHPATYGYILGELIRIADGRLPWVFLREEITQKLGADFLVGITPADFPRLAAPLFPDFPPISEEEGKSIPVRAGASVGAPANQADLHHIINPGGSGFTNGAGLARVGAVFANGGALDGVRYLSEALVAQVGEEQGRGDCPFFGPMRFGLGVALDTPDYPMAAPSFYHWGGAGGSTILIDPSSHLSLGFAPNKVSLNQGDHARGLGLIEARQARFIEALKLVLAKI